MRLSLPFVLLTATALAAPSPSPSLPTAVQTGTHPNARWAAHVDSRQVVTVDYDGAAAVLFPRQGPPRAVKFAANGKLRAPLVTPQGRVLALGLDFPRCEVAVWDVTAGRKVTALRGDFTKVFGCGDPFGTEFILSTVFSPDGRFVFTQDTAGLRRWDARTGKLLKALPGNFRSVAVSPDGRLIAVLNPQQKVEVWNADLSRRLKVTPPQPVTCLNGPGPWPTGAIWSPDSRKLAFSCAREVRVWNVATGGLQSLKREGERESPDLPTFSPDGRFVAADEDSAGVAVWQTGNGQRVAQIRLDSGQVQVTDIKITPGNLLLATLSDGRVLRLGLERPGTVLSPLRVFSGQPSLGLSLAVSHEGDRLAVADGTRQVKVFTLP